MVLAISLLHIYVTGRAGRYEIAQHGYEVIRVLKAAPWAHYALVPFLVEQFPVNPVWALIGYATVGLFVLVIASGAYIQTASDNPFAALLAYTLVMLLAVPAMYAIEFTSITEALLAIAAAFAVRREDRIGYGIAIALCFLSGTNRPTAIFLAPMLFAVARFPLRYAAGGVVAAAMGHLVVRALVGETMAVIGWHPVVLALSNLTIVYTNPALFITSLFVVAMLIMGIRRNRRLAVVMVAFAVPLLTFGMWDEVWRIGMWTIPFLAVEVAGE